MSLSRSPGRAKEKEREENDGGEHKECNRDPSDALHARIVVAMRQGVEQQCSFLDAPERVPAAVQSGWVVSAQVLLPKPLLGRPQEDDGSDGPKPRQQ